MRNQAIFILSALLVLLLHNGCTVIRGSQQESEASIFVQELVKTTQSWDGALLPAYPNGQPEVTIRRYSIPPGARLDTHHHPVINAGVLLSGQLTVVAVSGDTLQLNAGDPIVELVNTSHYGRNDGKVPAEIIVFYAGAVDTPISVVEPGK